MKTRSVPTIPGVPTPSFALRLDTYEVERLHVKFWSLVDMVHVGYRSQREKILLAYLPHTLRCVSRQRS